MAATAAGAPVEGPGPPDHQLPTSCGHWRVQIWETSGLFPSIPEDSAAVAQGPCYVLALDPLRARTVTPLPDSPAPHNG